MKSLRQIRAKNASATDRELAQRLRRERELERFSQYELAAELGITRAALSNFELCQAPLSFAAGYAFCRRLDISPRWLATGQEPKRPFPPLEELGLTEAEIHRHRRHGVNFLVGYETTLRRPIEKWIRENPTEKIVMRMLRGGLEPTLRRYSNMELVEQLQARIKALRGPDSAERKWSADIAEAIAAEIGTRLALRRGP